MGCPIILIHSGYSEYLKWALQQAKLFNDNVILLGNRDNEHLKRDYKFESIENLGNPYSKKFASLYEHMSTNPYKFEFICIERWFILLEYMERNQIDQLVHLDSDVMVYTRLDDFMTSNLKRYQAAFHILEQEYEAKRWVAGAGFSFWTRSGLKSFCDFVLEQYSERIDELRMKWNWHQETGKRGGICDMNLLYLFYRKNKDNIGNLALLPEDEQYCFDGNLASGDNYYPDEYKTRKTLFRDRIKKIIFIKKQPYAYHNRLDKKIAFYCLHCQGKYKMLMYGFYSGRHSFADFMGYLKFLIPFLWKRFRELIRYKFLKN